MNLLSRLLSGASKLVSRGLINAGSSGPRWKDAPIRRPNAAILNASALTAARAEALVHNSPHAAAAVNTIVNALVADGPAIRPSIQNGPLRDQLVALALDFWTDCDADGMLQLDGFMQSLARTLVVHGEFFVLMIADERGSLRLRQLSPDQIDRSLIQELGGGTRVVHGIEYAANGLRVAYHVLENQDMPLTTTLARRRIPASDMIHVFKPTTPGQVRGISWLSPSATTLHEIAVLSDALLAKHRTAALFGGIMRKPDAAPSNKIVPVDETGSIALEPGGVAMLPPGYEWQNVSPPATEGASEFLRSQICSAGIGIGVPYALMSGDLTKVNYSSGRLGLTEFRRHMEAHQKSLIVGRFLDRVWSRLLLLEALSGRLDIGAVRTRAEFTFTGWAQIDPLKETQADALAIQNNIRSRAEVIAARGRDPEVVFAEIEHDPFPRAGDGTFEAVEEDDERDVADV